MSEKKEIPIMGSNILGRNESKTGSLPGLLAEDEKSQSPLNSITSINADVDIIADYDNTKPKSKKPCRLSEAKNAVNQSLTNLKETISSHFSCDSNKSPTENSKMSRPVSKPACTHMNMTRLYGPNKCGNCGKVPSLGWVYSCTQDYDGDIPYWNINRSPEDVMAITTAARENDWKLPGQLASEGERDFQRDVKSWEDVKLKPWMEKAIAQGQYTDEQIVTLKKQRFEVIQKVKEAEKPRPYLESPAAQEFWAKSRSGSPVYRPQSLRCEYKICAECR
jgi:hypothetical protein